MSHSLYVARIAIGPFLVDHNFNVYFKSKEELDVALKDEEQLIDLILSLAVTNPVADSMFEKTKPETGLAISIQRADGGEVVVAGFGEAAQNMLDVLRGTMDNPTPHTFH